MGLLASFLRRLVNGPCDHGDPRQPTGVSSRDNGATLERTRDPQLVRLNPRWRGATSEGEEDTDRWPIEPTTGQPIAPRPQPGYYPGYHTLDQQDFWDEATRKLVLERVYAVPSIRFFSGQELRLVQAIVDRLIPQDDREEAFRIPLVPQIDKKLYEDRIPGYRYEDMPPQQEAMRLGLQGVDAIAAHLFGKSFPDLDPLQQDEVLLTLHDGQPPAGDLIWKKVSPVHFWVQLLSDAIEAYYAHPYAWDEIGFGGPAYPRGYFRLKLGEPEPWEVEEQRYSWAPPPTCRSAEDRPLGHGEVRYAPGQAGTH